MLSHAIISANLLICLYLVEKFRVTRIVAFSGLALRQVEKRIQSVTLDKRFFALQICTI